MPSPFPGMDPYLEGPTWMSFHGQLIAEIARQLAPRLRPKYVALMDERVVWDAPEDLANTDAPRSVEIIDVAHRQLVCAIQVLSLASKRDKGRRNYCLKRGRILQSDAHLIEIDLLRQGDRVPMENSLPAHPYFVFLSRARQRPAVHVWPIDLRDRLPTVPVPLLIGDAEVSLDVQAALTGVYDAVGYDLILDYSKPPPVKLTEEERTWVGGTLAERCAGRRQLISCGGGQGAQGPDRSCWRR